LGYKNGAELLPVHLLEEVQKYVDGGLVYIPRKSDKVGWGHLTGTRKIIDKRNEKINKLYYSGISVRELAEEFYLSEETIKKVIYGRK